MTDALMVLGGTAVAVVVFALWRAKRVLDQRADALVDWLLDYEQDYMAGVIPAQPLPRQRQEVADAHDRVERLLARASETQAGVPSEDDPILRVTVEEFIERAPTNNLPIDRPGEWADDYKSTLDQAYGEPPVPEDPPEPKKRPGVKLTPPVTRMYCLGCKNHWDCWVTDDGQPEDSRDLLCHCGGTVVVLPDE